MNLKNSYPKVQKLINRFLKIRRIILITFIIAFLVCLIVNLSVGGKLWFLYVLFGELIIYYAFFNKPLIDNILIKRISITFLIIIVYLYSIDRINNTDWSYIVINILSFSLIILQIIFFFVQYQYHKNKIIIMFFTSLFSCFFFLLALLNVIPINWAIITTGSIGLITLLILFIFYFKTTLRELKKYFSLK